MLHNLEKYDVAVKCYDDALRIDPKDSETWNRKGSTLIILGKYDEALDCFNNAIDLNPICVSCWFNKSNALYKLEKYDDSIRSLDEVIKLDPTYVYAWNVKGLILGSIVLKYDESIRQFDKVLEIEPFNASAWYERGCCKVMIGNKESGCSDLKKALEKDKENISELIKHDNRLDSIRNDDRCKSLFDSE